MSERSKGDTSSSLATAAPPTSGRVVKNPLLSASVTGLTFDDFQNKPLLLPAAPPIVHPTPVVSRESTPLVTVGKSSDIDTENLSEINLNDTSVTSSSANIADISDENSNSLLESTNQVDNSILSQAASSFSQLPSVASSVFSTFSKKFNSSSGREDFNSNPQLDIQPFTTPFVGQASVPQPQQIIPPPTVFGNQQNQQQIVPPPQSQPQAPPAEPPTFYSPTEVPSVPSGLTSAPPAAGQNTYRLSAKKKIYAQIPGLSSSHQEASFPASATGFPPPISFESSGAPAYPEHTAYEKPEERKGGLFSLSNLGVPNVLQNLSGFVQSATGISQRPQDQQAGQVHQPAYYTQTSQFNLTGAEQIPSAVNFFAPPASSASQSSSFVPTQVASEVSVTSVPPLAPFAQPPQGPPTTGALFSTQPPKSKTPEAGQPIFSQQETFFQPTTSTSRPPSVGTQVPSQPAKSLTPDTNPSVKTFASQQPSQPDFNSEKSVSGSNTNLFGPPPTAAISTPPTIFGPPPPKSSSHSNLNSEQAAPAPPPNLFAHPPTAGSYFAGPPPKSIIPESSSQPNLNSEQAASAPPPNLFAPPPTAGTHFSGPPPKSVTPKSNLVSQQAPSISNTNIFAPPPAAGPLSSSIVSEPPQTSQQVLQPFANSGVNLTGPTEAATSEANLAFKPFAPSLSSSHPPTSLSAGIPLPLETQLPPQVKPPSAGPPSSFFRLQKGTRLYKSPFAVASSENQPQVQITQNIFPPVPGAVTYFNPQQGFAPPQGQEISQPIQTQESILRPVQETSILPQKDNSVLSATAPLAAEAIHFFNPQQGFAQPLGQRISQPIPTELSILGPVQETSVIPPKDNSILYPSATASPLNKALDQPPTAEAVQFFNPQGLNSDPGLFDPAKTAGSLNIVEPLAAPEEFSTKPIVEANNFFNPQALNSVPELFDPTKEVAPLNILEPVTDQVGVSTKQSLSATNTPPVESINPQEITSPFVGLDTNTEQSAAADTNLSTEETYLSNQSPKPTEFPPSVQPSTILNPESEVKQEELTLLQEQQNTVLPPPPAVNLGISTTSKETANFPPPPPQHSFQNKPISNPYRKGLQPAHSQLSAPTSLSSFFTPIDQGNNSCQTISSGPIPEQQQLATNFFATSFVNPQEKSVNSSSETCKTPHEFSQESSKLSEDIITPSQDLQPLSEDIITSSQDLQPQIELESALPITEPTPISSVILEQDKPTYSEEPSKPEAPEKPASPRPTENLLSFYKPDIAPAFSTELPVASKPEENSKIASPLNSQDTPVPEPVPNLFTGYFDQAATSAVAAPTPVVVQRPSLPDPTTFFDSFSLVPSLGVPAPPTEDPNSQRIQNFFNNPPPKELDTVGDLNYNLVGSGLAVQNLQIRSLTPASNLAEPPSSSCSEFSELNSSLSAANRQPLIQAADSTKVSPEEEAIFESPEYQDLPEEIVNELKMANSLTSNNSPTNEAYKPAVKHWFYKRKLDVKCLWTPFSFHDSALLEEAFLKGDEGSNLVAVEGGRFDVNISERTKIPVYWEGEPIEVKRCSWFYKANDSKYVPYEEETADLLEEEYKKASESCEWHKKIPISAGDIVVFHGPTVIVHFQPQQQVDSWGGSTLDSESFLSYMKQQTITRPRVVKRDLDDFNIDEGESYKVDHLLFMVHGIGSACDLKMRSVEEVVDEFRSIALQLVQSHYKNSVESGYVGRVEVLPVSWHSELHSEEFGIDEKLKSITLESIPKLRNFTNDTLLDILFYTSPMFCQKIINTVTSSMNDIFVKYKQRNPQFHGEVSLAGHSLGSLIMFDLLCHQRPHKQTEEKNMENPDAMSSDFPVESNQLKEEEEGKNITYKMGQAGTGQPFISYPQLLFQPKKFFALGSPIGMFVTIRGIDKLGLDFRLPTCPGFYNIFHPYDPVAYRLEALVNPDMNGIPPVLIPHHKGRKRMHLELKETMSRVGADLKQRFFETFKTTLDSVNFLTPKAKNDPKELKEEVDKLLELQAQQGQQSIASTSRSRANSNSTNQSDTDVIEIDFPLGKLNDSKRVDYVLQEAPLEFFNEYLFALSSHVCYWESEDTILFVMKQIYNEIGISPDSQVPQQTMTIERPSSSGSTTQHSPTS